MICFLCCVLIDFACISCISIVEFNMIMLSAGCLIFLVPNWIKNLSQINVEQIKKLTLTSKKIIFDGMLQKFMGMVCQKCVIARSSRPKVFCKKSVLRNFTKFTGKHLCQILIFNKVAGLRHNFIIKETLAQMFSCEYCEISQNTCYYRTLLQDCLTLKKKTTKRNIFFTQYNF